MREMYDKQAKERMSQGGGDKKSAKAKSGKEKLPDPIPDQGQSRDKAGKLANVSGRTIDFGTKVVKQGVQELVEAVDAGRIAVSAAAKIAEQDPEAQRAKVREKREGKAKRPARKPHAKQPEPAPRTDEPEPATVRESPEESPPERTARLSKTWHELLQDLYRLTDGVRDAGGIEALAARWSASARKKNLAELRRLAGELAGWADRLKAG
jgi:hypothetical protein